MLRVSRRRIFGASKNPIKDSLFTLTPVVGTCFTRLSSVNGAAPLPSTLRIGKSAGVRQVKLRIRRSIAARIKFN